MTKEELKEAKELLKTIKSGSMDRFDAAEEALDIIHQYATYDDFIDEDLLDEYARHEAKDGAVRLMYFLAKCEPSAPYGYRIDGYGNACNVELDDIELALEDIISEQEENGEQ